MKHLEVPMRTALPSKLLKKVTKLENQSDITARKGNSNIFKKAPLRLRSWRMKVSVAYKRDKIDTKVREISIKTIMQ